MKNITIPTYVINLPERADRRLHIEKQFKGKSEFDLRLIEACKHKFGAVSLWLSIRKIIEMAIKNEDDVIVICKDDHEFTEHYCRYFLIKNIIEAHEQYIDYLCGGIGGLETAFPITNNLFWINQFLSVQFIVVYRKIFKKILDEPFNSEVNADLLLSEMTANKIVIYPFISIQGELNHSKDKIMKPLENSFLTSSKKLEVIQKMHLKFYPKDKALNLMK